MIENRVKDVDLIVTGQGVHQSVRAEVITDEGKFVYFVEPNSDFESLDDYFAFAKNDFINEFDGDTENGLFREFDAEFDKEIDKNIFDWNKREYVIDPEQLAR